MNTQRVMALLGRRDEPTDAVEEYCRYLAAALAAHDIAVEIERFQWETIGWAEAFARLHKSATDWRGQWVLVQYTALAWSTRGFPLKVLRVVKILKSAGARVAIVFHDVEPFPGSRLIDRLRRMSQIRTMRRAIPLAERAFFTVPPANLSWLSEIPGNSAFIPVGANLPIPVTEPAAVPHTVPTIGVFGITGGESGARETKQIIAAVTYASQKLGNLCLSVFGRHAELRETNLRKGLQNFPVELVVEGVLQPNKVVQKLCACDLLLFVRGPISTRRGSAIAAIACGVPVIAFSGSETAAPITEAGVLLIPPDQAQQLLDALVRVLLDSALRAELSSRSRAAYQEDFSWPAIATRFAGVLKD